MALILNIRTGHITPQYYVAFDGTFSIMEHKSKVAVPVNCKNLVDEHSELTTQENFIFAKERHPKKISIMPLYREAWKEDSQYPDPQDLLPGSNVQAAHIRMT